MRDSPHSEFLLRASRDRDAAVAAAADNCRFDERADADRWATFEAMLAPGTTTWGDWAEAYQLHWDQQCEVAADAFLDVNRAAWLNNLSENQSLVRIEDISRALEDSGLDLEGLRDVLQRADGRDDDASQAVRGFFTVWNDRRDARPAFAAFWDEVRDELDGPDWPHALRDRLGLGHYGCLEGQPRPVALMRYPVADVYAAQEEHQLRTAWALPTVLDGGMHEFFFPVPREHPFGATVHLGQDKADLLTAEVLHCRIVYAPGHLCRLGEITHLSRLDGERLREARDLHLYALREACVREDFGEPMQGRT